jgi:hypothetical protein
MPNHDPESEITEITVPIPQALLRKAKHRAMLDGGGDLQELIVNSLSLYLGIRKQIPRTQKSGASSYGTTSNVLPETVWEGRVTIAKTGNFYDHRIDPAKGTPLDEEVFALVWDHLANVDKIILGERGAENKVA